MTGTHAEHRKVATLLADVHPSPAHRGGMLRELVRELQTEIHGFLPDWVPGSEARDCLEVVRELFEEYDEVSPALKLYDICTSLPWLFPPQKKSVKALVDYLDELAHPEEKGHLNRLRDELKVLSPIPQDWRTAYQITRSEFGKLDPLSSIRDFHDCIDVLLAHAPLVLWTFLRRVAYRCEHLSSGFTDTAESIRDICRRYIESGLGDRVPNLESKLPSENWGSRKHIATRIARHSPDDYELTMWWYLDTREPDTAPVVREAQTIVVPDRDAIGLRELPGVLWTALERELAEGGDLGDKQPILEFLLPEELLFGEPVERWPTADLPLGELLPVVLRLDRQRPPESVRVDHTVRWGDLLGLKADTHRIARVASPAATIEPDCVGVVVGNMGPDRERFIHRMIGRGTPLILWHRGGEAVRILTSMSPIKMPDMLREHRRRKGRDVALIWDNPHWFPDGTTLTWKEPREP
ncbi:hypothetical protein Lfu02_41780 [Longispora fulva]|uniref:vWA-MoxR associated protein C-terminal domain-containing protein n=1 Tax=Longispora fulva TaxID=619741 RepID=A0A8J7KWJ3_9ACTN|nr:hypothetical protein [Longispora fulva]MBG6136637.1 hypothetical protein [Longispora fulva]GIG59806.1 hypothetical protein Lfu02_41780 [Longispora fulva]